MMKRQYINLGGIIFLVTAVVLIYSLLLAEDELVPFSIRGVLSSINRITSHWHVLVAGLLPIYLAVVIFGTAILGVSFGSAIQKLMARFIKHR